MKTFEFLFELEQSLHSFETRSNADKVSQMLSPSFFEYGSRLSWG
jgi:hypothetical protein